MRAKVPTSNFFTQLGYEHNPVARKNNTAAALLSATDAVMDRETQLPGAKDLAAAF
jgi:predicted lactoylglutathione lyase